MTDKRYNFSRHENETWRRYALVALGDAMLGDSPEDVARQAVRAASVADTMVYLERLRFETSPQPTAYVAPELDEPPLTPREEPESEADERIAGPGDFVGMGSAGLLAVQRAAIEAEKARIDAIHSTLGEPASWGNWGDLQPEPAAPAEVEP